MAQDKLQKRKAKRQRKLAKKAHRKKLRQKFYEGDKSDSNGSKKTWESSSLLLQNPAQKFPEDLLNFEAFKTGAQFDAIDEVYLLKLCSEDVALLRRTGSNTAGSKEAEAHKRWSDIVNNIKSGKLESPAEAYVRLAQKNVDEAGAVYDRRDKDSCKRLRKADGLLKAARQDYERKTGIPSSKLYKLRGWSYKGIGMSLQKTAGERKREEQKLAQAALLYRKQEQQEVEEDVEWLKNEQEK